MKFFFFSRGPHTKQEKMVRKPPYSRAGCIVESHNASRHQNSHVRNVRYRVVSTYPARCNFFHGQTLQMHGFLYKHIGILQRAVTLILRRESKKSVIRSRILTYSACPYKNYLDPQVLPVPPSIYCKKSFFFKATRTLSRKKFLSKTHVPYNRAECIAVLRHLPLSKNGRATVVADSSSIQQASGYNTSCMVAYACTWPSNFLNNAHRDSKYCKHMASLYHIREL